MKFFFECSRINLPLLKCQVISFLRHPKNISQEWSNEALYISGLEEFLDCIISIDIHKYSFISARINIALTLSTKIINEIEIIFSAIYSSIIRLG